MIDKLIPLICMFTSITVTAELAPPVLSKPSSIFQSRISIAISSQDTSSGVWISYTLDGTVPDINSFEATPSKWRFEFDSTVTLSAICIKKHTNDGNVQFEKSAVVVATYTKKLTIPLMEPFLFNFEDSLCLHLKAPEKGAKVYFTVDGSEPSENSILFHDSIILKNTTILRYIAVKPNCINSEIMTRKIVKSSTSVLHSKNVMNEYLPVKIEAKQGSQLQYEIMLNQSEDGKLSIHKITGDKIADFKLVNTGKVIWNTMNTSAGVYLISVKTSNWHVNRSFCLIK